VILVDRGNDIIRFGNEWFVEKPLLEKSLEWQYGILAVMGILAIATLVYAHKVAKKEGSSYPYFLCLGAALATFYEPLGDLFVHVAYHEVGQINFTTAFGFSTPLWVVPAYIVFFGLTVLLLLGEIAKGVTVSRWMLFFFASLPGAWLFEVPLLKMGSIDYYGANQPFSILDYPVWMAFANSTTMFVVATAVALLMRTETLRKRPYLLAVLMPMLVLGANGGVALPLGSALNSAASVATVNAMALLSMALGLCYTWICGCIIVETAAKGRISAAT
jgi:hypothetical protein